MSTQHEDKIDLDQLEALALKLGGDKWETADDVDGVVFGGDADSVCACHANAGAMPEFIYPSDRADFIAAADPATVLRLIALARKAQEPAIPEGMALLPIDPTEEMIAAGYFGGDLDIAIGHAAAYQRAEEGYKAMLAAAGVAPQVPAVKAGWLPIESAPRNQMEMFVVRGFDVPIGSMKYTTDAWAVWAEEGNFVRWPHKFKPTHWMPLPAKETTHV